LLQFYQSLYVEGELKLLMHEKAQVNLLKYSGTSSFTHYFKHLFASVIKSGQVRRLEYFILL